MEEYDKAVEAAMESQQGVDEFLRYLSGEPKRRNYSQVRFQTSCQCPPIPVRDFDWSCVDGNTYDAGGPLGHGKTETDAIINLIEQIAERDDEDPLQVLIEICHANQERQKTCEECGSDPCICHSHECQQCGKSIKHLCVCANPNRMDWCSPNCRAAFDL